MNVTPPKHAAAETPTPAAHGHGRKKGACVRSWQQVDSDGQVQVVETGKHDIMRRTGLPARDLRILDPVLSYPSTVLGRERAIVVNLEHIKAIITAQEVLFLNPRDPLVTPFVKKLQGIILRRRNFNSPQEEVIATAEDNNGVLFNLEEQKQITVSSGRNNAVEKGFLEKENMSEEGNAGDGEQQAAENAHGLKFLPFEFVALEACLETACSSLDDEARRLEQETHPAMDKLTSKISTLNLEHVRQIKSRLVAIIGRVQKVRDELEHLLDDDEDMAEMYLTDKLEQQHENSSLSSISELDDLPGEGTPPDEENRTYAEIIMKHGNRSLLSQEIIPETHNQHDQFVDGPNYLRRDTHRTVTNSHSINTKQLNVVELEMILEAYFMQIEGTLNKLSTLREYVDDTENYINIALDDKQNHLLQMGVMLATATVVVSAFMALTGVFGMNIRIELTDPTRPKMPQFLWTVAGGTIGCVVMYVVAIGWYKHKRLLQ